MSTTAVRKSTPKSSTVAKVGAGQTGPILTVPRNVTAAQVRAFVKASETDAAREALAIARFGIEHNLATGVLLAKALGISEATVSRRLYVGRTLYRISETKAVTEAQALAVTAVCSAYGTAGKVDAAIKAAKVTTAETIKSWYVSEANRLATDETHRASVYAAKVGKRTPKAPAAGKVSARKASPDEIATNAVAMLSGIKAPLSAGVLAMVRAQLVRLESLTAPKAPKAPRVTPKVLAGVTVTPAADLAATG